MERLCRRLMRESRERVRSGDVIEGKTLSARLRSVAMERWLRGGSCTRLLIGESKTAQILEVCKQKSHQVEDIDRLLKL